MKRFKLTYSEMQNATYIVEEISAHSIGSNAGCLMFFGATGVAFRMIPMWRIRDVVEITTSK